MLAALLVLGVMGFASAKSDVSGEDRRRAQCGVCHVIVKNLENIRLNSLSMINQGPYGMETEVLIDEALTHVCGVSAESLKSLGFDDYFVLEECTELIFNNDEKFESLMRKGMPDAAKICSTDVPVCKGLDPERIPQPSVLFHAPKHPKDRKTASTKVIHDEL
jgi:hypothetical protein